MEQQNTFFYTYSAQEQQEVLDIRKKYLPHEESLMEKLKALDSQTSRPAKLFAYLYGTVSAIIMGAGMSLVMTDIGMILGLTSAMVPGIAIGIIGLGMALTTYPIYKKILEGRKKKFAPEILKISEQLMQN